MPIPEKIPQTIQSINKNDKILDKENIEYNKQNNNNGYADTGCGCGCLIIALIILWWLFKLVGWAWSIHWLFGLLLLLFILRL